MNFVLPLTIITCIIIAGVIIKFQWSSDRTASYSLWVTNHRNGWSYNQSDRNDLIIQNITCLIFTYHLIARGTAGLIPQAQASSNNFYLNSPKNSYLKFSSSSATSFFTNIFFPLNFITY